MFELMGILGRGIQRLHKNGPWVLTEDLEMCDQNFANLAIRKTPVDDTNKCCMVGGGELNLLAGCELYKKYGALAVVCAYGNRSEYLKAIDAPSESMVMSDLFREQCPKAPLIVWTKEMSIPDRPNTNSELRNIFRLTLQKNLKSVAIVTIDLHMPRTMVFARRHLAKDEFRDLYVQYFVSEEVLVEADPIKFTSRRMALRTSKAFERNWQREQAGILHTMTETYDASRDRKQR